MPAEQTLYNANLCGREAEHAQRGETTLHPLERLSMRREGRPRSTPWNSLQTPQTPHSHTSWPRHHGEGTHPDLLLVRFQAYVQVSFC